MPHESIAQHYAQLIGLARPWQVSRVEVSHSDQDVRIYVVRSARPRLRCPKCDRACGGYDTRERRGRHRDTMQYRTYLIAEVPRVRCEAHGVRQVAVPWSDPLGRFALRLHETRTRRVSFLQPPSRAGSRWPRASFCFLGFVHHWRRSRKGNWAVAQQTAKDRFAAAVRRLSDWCRFNRHHNVSEQHQRLSQMLRGHYAYYGLPGNGRALTRYRYLAFVLWMKWLERRSQRRQLPSYRAMLDREGAAGPGDVAFLGDEATLRAGLARLRDAGVTHFAASCLPVDRDAIARTRAFLHAELPS